MSSINILFIISDLERGGPELRLLDFAQNFSPDIKMHICVTSEDLSLLEHFQACNVGIMVKPIRKVYLNIGKISAISRYVKRNRITIINAFDLKGLLIAVLIRIVADFSLRIVYHDVNSIIEFTKIQLFIFGKLLKFCQEFICNSRFSKTELGHFVPRRTINVIHNGVDCTAFTRNLHKRYILRSDLEFKEEEIILGIVANFRRQKNYPFLLRAFEILSAKHGNLKLLCVGGGKYLEQTIATASQLNLAKKIIFTGYSGRVIDYLNTMDILVLPSLWEGLPNAIIQAMSMGIPVVASNVGGCPEIVNNMKNGMLFPSNNLDEFVEAVEMLIEDRDFVSRLGANAKRTAEERFSLRRMIEDYARFYKELSVR